MDPPQEIERMAARRAAEGGYRDADDYVAQLVAADTRDAFDGAREGALLEGLGGDGEEWNLWRCEPSATLLLRPPGAPDRLSTVSRGPATIRATMPRPTAPSSLMHRHA